MSGKLATSMVLVIFVVAMIETFIPQRFISLHDVLHLPYFIPIILVALSSGRKGGLLVAMAISLFFLPHFFFAQTSRQFIEEIAAIVVFLLSGYLVGSFRESSEIELNTRLAEERLVVPVRDAEWQRVLFYNDGSALSLASAKWFVGKGYNLSKMSMVLLMVTTQDREEMFADTTMAYNQHLEKEQALEQSLIDIKKVLLEGGIEEKNFETAVLAATKKVPISDKIIEYMNGHKFDYLLLCKHHKKKSEEFLFGDTAMQVLRKTTVPLVIVKGSGESIA